MKPRACLPVCALCSLAILSGGSALGQLEENLGGMTNTNAEKYLAPLDTGLSGTLNSAIFRTGHVPRSNLTFTVGVAAMAIGFNDDDRTYVPTDPAGFTSLEPGPVPTVIGDPTGRTVAGQSGLYHAYPGGFDIGSFQLAVPQVTIGAIKGTRALVRYVAVDVGDAEIGDLRYLGVGVQHSLSQWLTNFPVDLAAGFFMHEIDIGDDLLKTRAHQINLTASREYGFLQPYIGIGLDSVQSDLKYTDETSEDLSLDFSLETQNDVRLTLGTLLRFSVLSLFAEFNAAAGTGFALGLDLGM